MCWDVVTSLIKKALETLLKYGSTSPSFNMEQVAASHTKVALQGRTHTILKRLKSNSWCMHSYAGPLWRAMSPQTLMARSWQGVQNRMYVQYYHFSC